MNDLEIVPEVPKSTGVNFLANGSLTLYGVSYQEDPKVFYQSLIDWVKEYVKNPVEQTELLIRLKYFNTSSSKCILELLNNLTKLKQTGKHLSIKWCYEEGDEDMQDTIELFQELIHHDIEQVKVESYSI